jgi:SAM-dependent methyltransferase
MAAGERDTGYHLGYTDEEHARLIRQATRLAPVTERFFREAGIATGQRILDVGSGVGDVAMLASKIVGPSGSVTGIERDASSVNRARLRAAEARLHNVAFVQGDVDAYSPDSQFDAAVGRYVLQFLPDPVASLRRITEAVRPGGVVAFQEGSWAPFLSLSAHLPLWHATVSLLHEAGVRGGIDLEMGPALHRVFQEAGLPAPAMRLEMELGYEPEFTRWTADVFKSVLPQIRRFGLPCDRIGDLDTLRQRLHDEVISSKSVVPWIGLVAAWCRKPTR